MERKEVRKGKGKRKNIGPLDLSKMRQELTPFKRLKRAAGQRP
jgi:hypothetical protein